MFLIDDDFRLMIIMIMIIIRFVHQYYNLHIIFIIPLIIYTYT